MFFLRKNSQAGICEKENPMPLLRLQNSLQTTNDHSQDSCEVNMTPTSAADEQIAQLQQQEQQLQQMILQRQTMQSQLLETENALDTLAKTKEYPFKMVGPLLVAVDKQELQAELDAKKDTLTIRLKNVEQQEEQLRKKFQDAQEKLLKQLQQK